MVVTGEMVSKCLGKKKNWSSPGLNKITNYWLKLPSPIHPSLAIAITRIINTKLNNTVSILPVWMPEGRTVMIAKKENFIFTTLNNPRVTHSKAKVKRNKLFKPKFKRKTIISITKEKSLSPMGS